MAVGSTHGSGGIGLFKPRSLSEALALLTETPGAQVIAGGTDLVPQMHLTIEKLRPLVDVSDLSELQQVEVVGDRLNIGAGLTHAALSVHPQVRMYAPLLAKACGQVGSPQIRNRGTLGGNLGTASPAGDTLPALEALGAVVRLATQNQARDLPLSEFLLGPKTTALRSSELIVGVTVPRRRFGQTGFYYKVGSRRSGSIALASAAGWMRLTPQGRFEDVSIALGSVAPTVVRARRLGLALSGACPSEEELREAVNTITTEIQPIDDIRASAGYRRQVVIELAYRGLTAVINGVEARRAD
jgi:CO/xanthine dehydrogenase FAD-binding subunit